MLHWVKKPVDNSTLEHKLLKSKPGTYFASTFAFLDDFQGILPSS